MFQPKVRVGFDSNKVVHSLILGTSQSVILFLIYRIIRMIINSVCIKKSFVSFNYGLNSQSFDILYQVFFGIQFNIKFA